MKTPTKFPPAWLWLVDEAIPTWVKKNYSPRESWKDKPFAKEDAHFFSKGIQELSLLFTEERPKGMPPYFRHPKYRSAYLLYFFPLQAAKFLTLFQLHPQAIQAILNHARQARVLRVADLGAGPGTASLSFLLFWMTQDPSLIQDIPIELDWFDTNADVMEDGKILVEMLTNSFPRLRGQVQVRTHVGPWWKAGSKLKEDVSLALVGHTLNETQTLVREIDSGWKALLDRAGGGGTLIVEPAGRRPSQILSACRDRLLELELIEKTPTQIWGPCLHAEACPLASGRDWCHFSMPAEIPGKWFRKFSEDLSSERHWVKFSYLWIASQAYPSPPLDSRLRRVISDPLSKGPQTSVLICEPETVGRFPTSQKSGVGRGDLVKITPPLKARDHR